MPASRLHRKLSPEGRPLFSLTIGDRTFEDHQICEISITRGASGYSYGIQPATLSTKLVGLLGNLNNQHVELKLQPWISELIRRRTGVPAEHIEWRFYGRVGIQDATDNGDGRTSFSNISASSYSTLLKQTVNTYRVRDRTTIINVVRAILEHPNMPTRLKTYPGSYQENEWDITYVDEAPRELTFKEIISEYADKQMILICERRDGRMHVQSLALRENYLINRAASRYAPLRSHTLAPATWSQPVESRTSNLILKERKEDGTINYMTWGSGTPEQTRNDYPIENEEIDLTHVRSISDTNYRVMRALNYQKNMPRVQISSIKFDLTHMLASNDFYDRRMAGELLRLEHGDAVYLSGDWQRSIRSTMIAQEIRETITPDKWEMEISLTHPAAVLGIHEIAPHPPRVWDQSKSPWDTEEGAWN